MDTKCSWGNRSAKAVCGMALPLPGSAGGAFLWVWRLLLLPCSAAFCSVPRDPDVIMFRSFSTLCTLEMEILTDTMPLLWIAMAQAYTCTHVCGKTLLASVVENSWESSPHQKYSLSQDVSAETNTVFTRHTDFTVTE